MVFSDAKKDLILNDLKENIKELKKEKTELKKQIVSRDNRLVTQEKRLVGVKSDLNEARSKLKQFEVENKREEDLIHQQQATNIRINAQREGYLMKEHISERKK